MASVFVADSFTQAETALRRIGDLVSGNQLKGERSIEAIDEVVTALNNLNQAAPTGWLDTIQYIEAQAAAFPGDEAWQDLKRRKDKLVADFQVIKARFEAVAAAIDAA
jgi:hypothetical protein